jgi:hypothetical protein
MKNQQSTNKPTKNPMEKQSATLVDERTTTKRIGSTTYIIVSRFNGDERSNIKESITRLIVERGA